MEKLQRKSSNGNVSTVKPHLAALASHQQVGLYINRALVNDGKWLAQRRHHHWASAHMLTVDVFAKQTIECAHHSNLKMAAALP